MKRIISYRIDDVWAKALEDRARLQGSGSRHEMARQLLIDHLAQREQTDLREQIDELTRKIEILADNSLVALKAILVALNVSEEEVDEWIGRNLLRV